MSKKSKKAKIAKQRQRVSLKPYLNQTVFVNGTISNFSNTIFHQIQGKKRNIIILQNVHINNLYFEQIFLLTNNITTKQGIGDQLSVKAYVNRYESIINSKSIYRYGLIIK